MSKGRMEAFSDGVLAIVITIMVLELKVPHEPTLEALLEVAPIFFSYVLSFIYVGIYWNNHHHLLHGVHKINGKILWANLHLLFWLSVVPFITAWVGETQNATIPMAFYGGVLMMAGFAYYILAQLLITIEGKESPLAIAIGKDRKGIASLVFYAVAIVFSFIDPRIAFALYVLVALMWFIPDSRIETIFGGSRSTAE
jgi:uncharacterized membrane protein